MKRAEAIELMKRNIAMNERARPAAKSHDYEAFTRRVEAMHMALDALEGGVVARFLRTLATARSRASGGLKDLVARRPRARA